MHSSSSHEETTAAEGAREDIDVAVVGGGQAGLAIGYFLSRRQHTRGSALLGWVKDDAEYIAREIRVHVIAQVREGRENVHNRAPETTAIEGLT